MDYPVFIKLYLDPNSIYVPLSNVHIFCPEDGYIDKVIVDGDKYYRIVDKNNNIRYIEDFKCTTIEELYVALDINDLVYGGKNFNIDEALKNEHEELIGLREENKRLKQAITEFKENTKFFKL